MDNDLPEPNREQTEHLADAFEAIAEHVLIHGMRKGAWPSLATAIQRGADDDVYLTLRAWASVLRQQRPRD